MKNAEEIYSILHRDNLCGEAPIIKLTRKRIKSNQKYQIHIAFNAERWKSPSNQNHNNNSTEEPKKRTAITTTIQQKNQRR